MKLEKKLLRLLKVFIFCLIFLFSLASFASSQHTYMIPELDFNGDCAVDLTDAILGMRVLTGENPVINGTKNIGVKEITDILRKTAHLRPEPDNYDEYEEDDKFSQARVIVINNSADSAKNGDSVQPHNFHDAGDEDWMMFYGIAGQIYTVHAETESLGSNCDPVIELYDTDGVTLLKSKNDGIEGKNETLLWKDCSRDDIYYVRLRSFSPDAFGEDTAYELTVYNPEATFPGDIIGNIFDPYSEKKVLGARIKTNANRSAISNYCYCYFYCRRDFCIYFHPAGTFTLTVEASGYKTFSTEVTVRQLETTLVDIEMIPE
ncbi:PEGA domain-containing protein [Desulfonema magnum]|uniref:PEGA domain-containing protein n=1 Tax=Desulfonema magnum TaxID=45655 RepID=A0A975GSR8_9BACT|nr:PEGA domain-containing protein [Desulfonema magnum]QTA92340.1 PEGA domain-containing protein [Desulfonema magnum]